MSPTLEEQGPEAPRIDELPVDDERGTLGMLLAIVTEALLFVCLFFAYFYVGHAHKLWPAEPPKYALAIVMLCILVSSSVVLILAEHMRKKGAYGLTRVLLWLTIALGGVFVVVQCLEYADHLKTLKPVSNAYGSLFYTITTFHGLHVLVGLSMLIWAGILPRLEPREEPPHKPLKNVSMYWHFVDVVWLFIVLFLYLLPRWVK